MEIIDYPRYKIYPDGRVWSENRGKFLAPRISRKYKGYYKASLSNENGVKYIYNHILVAKHYIPNPDNLPYVDHIDHNSFNNNVENLRWVTHKQNMLNAVSNSEHYNIFLTKFNKYTVQITNERKVVYQKNFDTLEEAIAARDNFYIANPILR